MKRKEAIEKLRQLVGKELYELPEKYGVTIYWNDKVNKGWAVHVFERYLELPINSGQSPNFGSWKLKSIPLDGILTFKETMAITMIVPINVLQKEFDESHLLKNAIKDKEFASLIVRMDYYIPPHTKGAGHGSKTRAFYARARFLKLIITN